MFAVLVLLPFSQVWANDAASTSPPPAAASNGPKTDKTIAPEEEDFQGTPYTEYADFVDQKEEDEMMEFYQFGRLFGVNLGLGYSGATGNRGGFWQGGFPLIDIEVLAWMDFNFAVALGWSTVTHNYESVNESFGKATVNLQRLGLDLRYYVDVRNVTSTIAFANPYIAVGVGNYTKSEKYIGGAGGTDQDSSFGFNAGAGFEFTITPRKSYFGILAKVHPVTFKDTYDDRFAVDGRKDMSGLFYTVVANFLFTW